MEVVPLLDLPHSEMMRLLASGAPVYLPVNPVEYHGPHLSLHNDHLISMALARDAHRVLGKEEGWPMLVAASIEAGAEPAAGPGTRVTPYPLVKALVERACSALADLGVRRVVLATFHGSPLHAVALDAGVRLLERRGVRAVQPLNLLMDRLVRLDVSELGDALAALSDEERHAVTQLFPQDFHAGFFETSLALHYVPETVSPIYRELPPCPEIEPNAAVERLSALARRAGRARLSDELHLAALGLGWAALRPFPGYTSMPALARADVGASLAARIIEDYVECVRSVFAGAPGPRPVLGWLKTVTLGGRIPTLGVPPEEVARFD
ncbi:MAG: hypothetical protein AMXMBFR56_45400 [Polyangiaceae bacterium]